MTNPAEFPFNQQIVWRPSAEVIARSRLKRFMDRHGIATFADLNTRAADDVAWFWDAVLHDLEIEFYEPYTQVVDLSRGIQWPEWCVGARLNIVHNCLDKWIGTTTEAQIALRWEGEEGATQTLTYGELFRAVNQVAAALRARGLGTGDAIAVYMPMTPETVIALLAIVKIGGIFVPLFSGFGADAITSRLTDADAKAIFVADGQFRRGKALPMKAVADQALADVDSVQTVIVLRRAGIDVEMTPGRDIWWADFVADQPDDTPTQHTRAEDPLMLIYTSGTTGQPKGTVHTHCGFPIKSAQDMAHGFDVNPGDVVYWMSDMGWMMGPWLVFGTLILGATMVLYDGAPDYPDVDRVWALCEEHGVTHLGLAPTFIRAIKVHGVAPVQRHDLSALRITGSTGEAWDPASWLWFFETVGRSEVPIINYSGGTEIGGGIVLGNVLLPLKPCAFSGPAPGMAVDVVDEHGEPVRGAVGELIVRQPWIGMTRGFWGDPQRYFDTYWSQFPGVWTHGDLAAIDADGFYYILGRSDDTLKVAGKRLGPAEVETVLVRHPAVTEAAAIGVPDAIKGQAVVAFVVLTAETDPCEALAAELRTWVADALGKPFAPKAVHCVPDIPKTRNAKVMRRVVRAAYLGEPLGNLAALVNPEAVEAIQALREYGA